MSDHRRGKNIYRIDRCDFPRVTGFSIFYSLFYTALERNFELHSPLDSTLAFSASKLYHIRDRMQSDVWEAEGVLEDEERKSLSRRWRIRWVRCSWFTFVFEIEGCAEKSRIHDENPRSFKVPDGNLVTYKHESVKRRSQGEGEAITSRFVRSTATNARDDREGCLSSLD